MAYPLMRVSMHEHARVSKLPVSIFVSPTNLTHNHEIHQGVAPPGLTYVTHRWRVKQGEGKSETQARDDAMHMCVCLITLNLPLIICNLLIYPSIVC